MDKIKPLFTATATVIGGRNGHAQSSDGAVVVDLSVPKEMGGPGKPGTATPEHLFAVGSCLHDLHGDARGLLAGCITIASRYRGSSNVARI